MGLDYYLCAVINQLRTLHKFEVLFNSLFLLNLFLINVSVKLGQRLSKTAFTSA